MADTALDLIRVMLGPDAVFRDCQLEAWRTPADVAAEFGVSETVVRRRLIEAMDRGVVTRRNSRYRASRQAMLPVFDEGT